MARVPSGIWHEFRGHGHGHGQSLDSDIGCGVRLSLVADWIKHADDKYSLDNDCVLNLHGARLGNAWSCVS